MASKAAIAKHKKRVRLLQKGSQKVRKERVRNRCNQCGRPRGYIGKVGLCRICLRKAALKGHLPGIKKISW